MREQKEQEKQNELLRVVAEQNHERLIEYDVKEDRAVVYAIENDRFEVLFDIEDYVKKNHYGSVFIDPEDKKVFRRAMHACLQKEGTVTVDVRYCEKENQPEWYRFYLVSIAEEDGKTDRMVGRFCCVQQEKAITERMRRRAEIDVLTNVYNHKAFEEYCAKELAECTTNALFVMLDIDDFKITVQDANGESIARTEAILKEEIEDFYGWYDCRDLIPRIQEIQADAVTDLNLRIQKIIRKLPLPEEEQRKLLGSIDTAAGKVVGKMMYGLRDYLDGTQFRGCLDGLEKLYEES